MLEETVKKHLTICKSHCGLLLMGICILFYCCVMFAALIFLNNFDLIAA
jgi:hypothetical protein